VNTTYQMTINKFINESADHELIITRILDALRELVWEVWIILSTLCAGGNGGWYHEKSYNV
jgi:hypothetical protein